MSTPNYAKIFAIKKKNQEIIKKACPEAREVSGIYGFFRESEDGFKFGYVGQAKNLLSRMADHLSGYQHIDLSIKKHGLYDIAKNQQGYKVRVLSYCSPLQCDEQEQFYIKQYANMGYQMRNKTSGSQGTGKQGIADNKPAKGYYDGVAYGEAKAKKKIKGFFDKYLDFSIKPPANKIKERKFNEFIDYINNGDK